MDKHPSRSLFFLFALGPALISCAGVKVVATDNFIRHEVARIAMSPSGGELADAIVVSMRKSEQNTAEILDTLSTAKLLKRLGMMSIKATLPENLHR